MIKHSILVFRSVIFYIGLIISLLIHTPFCIILGLLLPAKLRFPYFVLWNKFILWWLSFSCSVNYSIVGEENVPTGAFVLLSNHQSTWETIFIYSFFQPITAVLKKSLLYIPFFGWALALLKPLAIDRSKKRSARNTLLKKGKTRLEEGISVVIFPEGTRLAPDASKAWSTGGATLAIETNTPILPLSHNAGEHWPTKQFTKTPGTIKIVIGKPIPTKDRSPRELTEQISQWVKQTQAH